MKNKVNKMVHYNEVDALIIGGGILGVSTLYHLTKKGMRNLVLLEKSVLTAGSTWHASGDIGLCLDDPLHLWFANYSSQLYQKINFETDGRVGWKQTGGLKLAYNSREKEAFERIIDIAEQQDLKLELISPDIASQLHPFFDFTGVHCCLFSPNDGHVDPYGTTIVMAERSRDAGAKIIERCRATSIVPNRDYNWMVSTNTGNQILARCVIMACGCYTRQFAQQLGFNLPVYTFLHHYFVTETIPELKKRIQPLPIIRDEDCGGYIRQELDGLLIGTSENRCAQHVWEDGVPWDEEHTLFNVDYDSVEYLLDSAVSKIPVLGKAGIKRSIRGVVTYTPDGRMFLGPIDDSQTLWVCAGASSGIAWGGGIGKSLADWIVKEKTFEFTKLLDPIRFKGKDSLDLRACAEKVFLERGRTRAYDNKLLLEDR